MEISIGKSYDVFIDFSSTDTRYSFVSHLSAAFRRKKISIFTGADCALTEAEAAKNDFQLPKAIESAIKASKVFVVVFSKNYAFSPLCLETIVTFLGRPKDELVAIPVFYGNVTPLIVEQQTDKFKDAFENYQGKYSDDRITQWRKGLIEMAGLPGHDSINQPNDSELVEEIVANVYEKLDPTGKIGIYSRLLDIENFLCKKSQGVYRLGIWGMPGIGKTAFAHAVFNQMSCDFAISFLVEDFHRAFHEKGVYDLRKEHFKNVPKGESIAKPSFIVLDDVRNLIDVESFLEGFTRIGPGSVIIITSRDKQVLNQCQVDDVYEVPSLNMEETLRVFTQYIPKNKETKHDSRILELSEKIFKYVNGNPKALHFCCIELKDKTIDEMEAVFGNIKQDIPHEIVSIFRTSYDELSDDEKNIFLDIVCFFNGEQHDHVMRILDGCGFFPHVGIERLVERSLFKISEDKKVEMNSLIQEIGRKIANGEKDDIMRRCRLWDPSIIQSFLEKKESEGVEVIEEILLDTTDLKFDINSEAFGNMYNLRLLKIYSPNLETTPQELHLPDGLQSLPYELRLLHWEHYPLQSLPQDFDPSHLVELILPYSHLKNLRKGPKSLAKLKIINLSYSQQLVEVEELTKSCSLEQIYLQGCVSLKSIPEIKSLKHLKVVNLSGCTNIKHSEIILKLEGSELSETSFASMVFCKQDQNNH